MAKRILFVISLSLLLIDVWAQQRIPMQLDSSGLFTIPCEVNGLKLRFVFDTGSSDVHLSLLDAAFMIKNGYLDKDDFIGKDAYSTADGSVSENAVVCLKEIKIGNTIINDVRASISSKLDAPLLLGQSAINKIGKYTIDNNYLILYENEDSLYDDTYTDYNGGEYDGEMENGLKHGRGTYIWENGDKYDGQWFQDKRNGFGTLYYKNGDKYIGNWVNDIIEGRGVMITAEGEQYVGEWKDDLMNGKGTVTWPNGDKYVGEFKDGLRDGEGTYSWNSGAKYIGSWRSGLRNGYGTYYYSDGTSKKGYWENDKLVNK